MAISERLGPLLGFFHGYLHGFDVGAQAAAVGGGGVVVCLGGVGAVGVGLSVVGDGVEMGF